MINKFNYKPKNKQERAFMDAADEIDRIQDSRTFWKIGMVALWIGAVAMIFIPGNTSVPMWAFLAGAIICNLIDGSIRMKAGKKSAKLIKEMKAYNREKAVPLFNEMTEKFPDHHVHLHDDGIITLKNSKQEEDGNDK